MACRHESCVGSRSVSEGSCVYFECVLQDIFCIPCATSPVEVPPGSSIKANAAMPVPGLFLCVRGSDTCNPSAIGPTLNHDQNATHRARRAAVDCRSVRVDGPVVAAECAMAARWKQVTRACRAKRNLGGSMKCEQCVRFCSPIARQPLGGEDSLGR